MNERIKILVVDDSISYRQIMQRVIANIPDAECVATAASGPIALRKIQELQPDLVLLDMVMPDMDGVATLQRIKQHYPAVEAIMISSFDMGNAKETLRSLQIGALDFIAKPKTNPPEQGIDEWVQYLRPLVDLLQTKKLARFGQEKPFPARPEKTIASDQRPIPPRMNHKQIDLIVIGISTGGPKALDQLMPQLPAGLPCPIIIVQHMPPMFTESLAMKLNEESALQVKEATGGEALTAGRVYIAPGGRHLTVEARNGGFYLAVNETPPVNNCRPSVDVLFQSVASVFSGNVLAVVMTGMGRDGTEGVRALKQKGAKCLVQDQASSIVWGMPGSVHEAGLADEVLALKQLGARITELAMTR